MIDVTRRGDAGRRGEDGHGARRSVDMFVQLIEGRVADRDEFRRQSQRWVEELAPSADGWLGLTCGITEDGVGFCAARFASADAARRNSDRPEQGEWWAAVEATLEGPADFVDCEDVEVLHGDGGSDEAGFVQVIRGRMRDDEEARQVLDEAMSSEGWRPDVVGSWVAHHPDGAYTQLVYFTSEEDARTGEAAEDDGLAERMMALHAAPPTFLDLPDPWYASA